MRRLLACIAFAASPFANAGSSVTTDFSDLWFNPAESGWGANVIQQSDTLFVTLFVYGTDGKPTWYVASSVVFTGTSGSTLNFSGALFQTTGPYFGAASFNPSSVTLRQVGTLTFRAAQVSGATIAYTVDGVSVTKSVVRQTWKNESLNGVFLGASAGNWSTCGTGNGYFEYPGSVYTVAQDGVNISMREDGPGFTCTYSGVYSQGGRMGQITGNALCSDGLNQTFTASEVQVTLSALEMRLVTSATNGCAFNGRLGGVRRGS